MYIKNIHEIYIYEKNKSYKFMKYMM